MRLQFRPAAARSVNQSVALPLISTPSQVLRRQPYRRDCRVFSGSTQSSSGRSKAAAGTLGSRDDIADNVDNLGPATGTEVDTIRNVGWFGALEARHKVLITCSLSFVICNMDKVNMSVAIIPMAMDFGWSPSVSGIVQSSFFYGYMLCQLPGGMMASKYGGRQILPFGVGMWSMATAALPLLATTIPGLCLSRAAVGFGEATAPAATTDMIARIIPANERSRAVSFVFGGLHVGSILGLLAAPPLISQFGWEMVFYSFGALGLVWCLWFESVLADVKSSNPEIVSSLIGRAAAIGPAVSASGSEAEGHAEVSHGGHAALIDADQPIPWRAFLRNRSVQALMYTHFCNNWFHYTMLAWLPTYFTDTLSVDLMHAAQTALLPPLAGIAASATAGPLADSLLAGGTPVATVRRLAQCTAFLVPSALLLWACTPEVVGDTTLTVASITLALGISSFSLAGLYCTHQDLSPKYAPAMLGLTNTAGSIPGILGVATVGLLFDATQSWELALFVPSAFFMLSGAAVYSFLCNNAPVDFDAENSERFAWEPRLPKLSALPWVKQEQRDEK